MMEDYKYRIWYGISWSFLTYELDQLKSDEKN